MKYKKKPVIIDAIQWKGDNFLEIHQFIKCDHEVDKSGLYLHIKTLEGVMIASLDDYIIRGVQGEFYPCKPDIFSQTYEKVEQ